MNAAAFPSTVDDLTPAWFSGVLDADVTAVEIVDAHSGTTGRARVRVSTAAPIPEAVFVKFQPFDAGQRELVRMIGMGISDASFYAAVGNDVPVRVPHVWHSAFDDADGSFVMVLEDLAASGCRFPNPDDDDVLEVATSLVDELAKLHAAYWGEALPWLRAPVGFGGGERDAEAASLGASIVQSALDQFGAEMPAVFGRLAKLYIERHRDINELLGAGERTLVHGDAHIGNLFVDEGRTGFYDWAIASRMPGMRDVAYFLCNSLPTDLRRAEEHNLLARYRAGLAEGGVTLDDRTAHEQYRLLAVYSWISATTTAAMGSQWQPREIGHRAMVRTTVAITDLDTVGLLVERLGNG